jgi:hypothetical protein
MGGGSSTWWGGRRMSTGHMAARSGGARMRFSWPAFAHVLSARGWLPLSRRRLFTRQQVNTKKKDAKPKRGQT